VFISLGLPYYEFYRCHCIFIMLFRKRILNEKMKKIKNVPMFFISLSSKPQYQSKQCKNTISEYSDPNDQNSHRFQIIIMLSTFILLYNNNTSFYILKGPSEGVEDRLSTTNAIWMWEKNKCRKSVMQEHQVV